MTRREADREDLLAEAVALVRRVEFTLPEREESVVCGFRRDGGLSVYLGQDPAFHFDAEGRLRRAYHRGKLYRTQGSTLAEMTRERSDAETTLVRRDLPPERLAEFLDNMRTALRTVQTAIAEDRVSVTRQVPEDDVELLKDVEESLERILNTGPPLAPAIAGKP